MISVNPLPETVRSVDPLPKGPEMTVGPRSKFGAGNGGGLSSAIAAVTARQVAAIA
jgi:hypothetical protein